MKLKSYVEFVNESQSEDTNINEFFGPDFMMTGWLMLLPAIALAGMLKAGIEGSLQNKRDALTAIKLHAKDALKASLDANQKAIDSDKELVGAKLESAVNEGFFSSLASKVMSAGWAEKLLTKFYTKISSNPKFAEILALLPKLGTKVNPMSLTPDQSKLLSLLGTKA